MKHNISRRVPSSVAAIVLGLGVLVVSPAQGFRGGEATAAEGVSAIHGTITRGGSPASADILVVAWPDQDRFDTVAIGEQVRTVSLAAGRTDSVGQYKISLDPAAVPADYIDDDGQVDIELRIADAVSEASYFISLITDGSSWTNASDRPAFGTSGGWIDAVEPSVSIDLGTGRVKDSSIDLTSMEGADGEQLSSGEAAASLAIGITGRSETFNQDLAAKRGSSTWIPMPCGAQLIDYTRGIAEYPTRLQGAPNLKAMAISGYGTSHTMGVAADINGVWKQDGTRTVSMDDTATLGPRSGAYYVGNRVNYKNLRNDCTPTRRYFSMPHNISTLLTVEKTATRHSFARCDNTPSGWTYTKSRTKSVTMSAGLTVKGISLTAQSGWNADTKLQFGGPPGSVWESGPAKICYSNLDGPTASASIGANSR